jgi:5-methylcytosine-specific restriction endonuclease McrA
MKWRKRYGRNRRWVKRQLLRQYGAVCALCEHRIVNMKDVTLDHIVPLSKGGVDELDNICLAHENCNQAKRDMMPDEWAAFRAEFA